MPSLETNPSCSGDLRPISRQSITSSSSHKPKNLNHFLGGTDTRHQFQFNQSSHASPNQCTAGNPAPGYQISNPSNKIRSHSRYSHQTIQPSLINLDRMDLSVPLFQYPLLSGVTMLGTGKDTVRPPDIVLHGSQIAPQHAFIERLGDEVILHPISENTTVDGRRISGPTPLQPGNLISIGESYFFRYDGPPPSYVECQSPHNRFYFDDSPYAVINPRSGKPSRSAGDVNKSPFLTMDTNESSASSITLESSRVCPTDSYHQSPRSSSASTSTSDPDQASSICTEDSGSHKYRDGLESENFVNKIARFEYFAHNQPPPPFPTVNTIYENSEGSNGNGNPNVNANNNGMHTTNGTGRRLQEDQQMDCPSSRHYYNPRNHNGHNNSNDISTEATINGYGGGQSTFTNNKPGGLSRPNVNFNRSEHGFGGSLLYSSNSNNNNHLDDSSISSSSVSPPDRIPSSTSYRRTGGVTFYEDGNVTTPSPASLFLTDFENDEESSSFVNHSTTGSSVPSPDSLSSISNHNASKSQNQNHYHHNGERVPSRNSSTSSIIPHPNSQHSSFNENQASIACETLLNIKRKQADEVRLHAEANQKDENLRLDEILAMCAEYEEQIAQEILEKRTNSVSKLSVLTPYPSSLSLRTPDHPTSVNTSGANSNGHLQSCGPMLNRIDSVDGNHNQMPNSPTTPTSAHLYNRIKTNGSLPRDASRKNFSPLIPSRDSSTTFSYLQNNSNSSNMDEEIASIFTFSVADNKTSSSSIVSANTTKSANLSFNEMSDDVFSSKSPPKGGNKHDTNGLSQSGFILGLRNNKSPYENVMANNENSGSKNWSMDQSPPCHYAQIHSPPRLGLRAPVGLSNNRSPSEPNGYARRPILTSLTDQKTISEMPNPPPKNYLPISQNNVKDNQEHNHPQSHHSGYCNVNAVKISTDSINRNGSNGNSPVDKTERSDTPQKSKLSVSFANYVKEFGEEDENAEDPVRSIVVSKGISPVRESKDSSRSIVKTIATEVQVHAEDCSSKNRTDVNNEYSDADISKQMIQSPPPPSISVSNFLDEYEDSDGVSSTRNQCSPSSLSSFSTNASQNLSQSGAASSEATSFFQQEDTDGESVSSVFNTCLNKEVMKSPYQICFNEDPIAVLKKNIREVEEQEMEAIREMEIEKALLLGEVESLENQLASEKEDVAELKDRLVEIDECNRRWKADGLERIAELKAKLMCSEKELQRLERMHEEFCGSTDEETVLLERLKFQHELVESDRKTFEDAEFHHMEEEINKEAQRDELSKTVTERSRRILARQSQLEKLLIQNKASFGSSTKEIQNLENIRQDLIKDLRKTREPSKQTGDMLCLPDSEGNETLSDCEDATNSDLEEKLRSLSILNSSSAAVDDATHIERIKSRSPIDPKIGSIGPKTSETLREIERNREFLLNEQGVQMLEEERARVRELQKRVQDAVREEWEASRKTRSNQCQSLNSVGSEDSGHTVSDTPTDSGSGDDTTDKSAAQSISTTDVSLADGSGNCGHGLSSQNSSFELCQQMRQKQREMSQSYDETRPLSDGSAYDNGSSIVTMRDKRQIQNRPLTRYLPVRGDDSFDLRLHIEESGHQVCGDIIVTRTAARGYLSKLGSRFHNWNKRWFVFDRETRTFHYFSDKNEKKSKPRGGVHFEAIQEVYADHLQSELTFCVKTDKRVFFLLAPSSEAMRMWIEIIFTGAEGHSL